MRYYTVIYKSARGDWHRMEILAGNQNDALSTAQILLGSLCEVIRVAP